MANLSYWLHTNVMSCQYKGNISQNIFSCFTKIKLTHCRMFWSFLTHLARNIWRTFCPHILASDWSPLTKPHSYWLLPPNTQDWQLRSSSSFLMARFWNHHFKKHFMWVCIKSLQKRERQEQKRFKIWMLLSSLCNTWLLCSVYITIANIIISLIRSNLNGFYLIFNDQAMMHNHVHLKQDRYFTVA